MLTGTPYHFYILPYRIRVDDFATPLNQDPSEAPLLHLLTHTHSDHINGLSARSFGYKVYCSEDAKQMLLRHEVYAERELQALELRSEDSNLFTFEGGSCAMSGWYYVLLRLKRFIGMHVIAV